MTAFEPSLAADDLEHVLSHTRDLWEEVRGARLFITGGAGFFGMWLLESFLWANERLDLDARAVVLTRDPAALARKAPHLATHPSIELWAGSMERFDYPAGRFSHVIHAATEPFLTYPECERPAAFARDVQGTLRVLELARQCGAQRLLFASSGAVYGRQPPEMAHVSEEYCGAPDPMDTASGYGHAKRLSEHFCAAYARNWGIECKIARCFAFVGPYLPLEANYAVGNFIRDALQGGPIVVAGDGTPYRSYLYAADLAVWLWTILFRGASCRPYNVGSEVDLTISQLAQGVASAFQPSREVRVSRVPVPGRPAGRYVPSTRRAAEDLNLHVSFDLAAAITRTARWYASIEERKRPAPRVKVSR